jgi:hypothetical protein
MQAASLMSELIRKREPLIVESSFAVVNERQSRRKYGFLSRVRVKVQL